jgi:hypothetical protein
MGWGEGIFERWGVVTKLGQEEEVKAGVWSGTRSRACRVVQQVGGRFLLWDQSRGSHRSQRIQRRGHRKDDQGVGGY